MSVAATARPPMGDSPARARAKETLWRLAALALGHPSPEFHRAVASGDFHAAFSAALADVTGAAWPNPGGTGDFAAFEAGYIEAFLHGRGGKPTAALLAGDHEPILAGLTRPAFMLNLAAFYKHFGLKAATDDEGKNDEPDHLASMLELMAVLCHLEATALGKGRDPDPYRRAQRDFLCRYLHQTLATVAGLLRRHPIAGLDPTLAQLVQDIAQWGGQQITELEVRVGPFRGPDAPKPAQTTAEPASQNLWG
ncbi:MAG: molecular chaperone TorD family protein [Pseudomonadota bacterium]